MSDVDKGAAFGFGAAAGCLAFFVALPFVVVFAVLIFTTPELAVVPALLGLLLWLAVLMRRKLELNRLRAQLSARRAARELTLPVPPTVSPAIGTTTPAPRVSQVCAVGETRLVNGWTVTLDSLNPDAAAIINPLNRYTASPTSLRFVLCYLSAAYVGDQPGSSLSPSVDISLKTRDRDVGRFRGVTPSPVPEHHYAARGERIAGDICWVAGLEEVDTLEFVVS